jgi:hypothetical protein
MQTVSFVLPQKSPILSPTMVSVVNVCGLEQLYPPFAYSFQIFYIIIQHPGSSIKVSVCTQSGWGLWFQQFSIKVRVGAMASTFEY